MIPKLHKKGMSFKAAATYLLHDKGGAETDDRVTWTKTRNLLTEDPQLAWRYMAATSLDQARLKAQAGIANTGRKSKQHVLHLSLSWKEHEAEGLSPEEMIRAADGAVKALGAEDRQALYVAHDDEPHPHVHILLSRVSPEDGRLLPSSHDRLALSRWAQSYEQERGEILCPERVKNNAARDRGEFAAAKKDRPRHLFELESANDNRVDAEKVRLEQRAKDRRLLEAGRAMAVRHKADSQDLAKRSLQARREVQQKAKDAVAAAQAKVKEQFAAEWSGLQKRQREDLRAFRAREETALGRIQNTFKSMDLRSMVSGDERRVALRDVFKALSGSGGRIRAYEEKQAREVQDLRAKENRASREAVAPIKARQKAESRDVRQKERDERSELKAKQAEERAELQKGWRERRAERELAWTSGAKFHSPAGGTSRGARVAPEARREELEPRAKPKLADEFGGAARGEDGKGSKSSDLDLIRRARKPANDDLSKGQDRDRDGPGHER